MTPWACCVRLAPLVHEPVYCIVPSRLGGAKASSQDACNQRYLATPPAYSPRALVPPPAVLSSNLTTRPRASRVSGFTSRQVAIRIAFMTALPSSAERFFSLSPRIGRLSAQCSVVTAARLLRPRHTGAVS